MAGCPTPTDSLDLRPGRLDLCMYDGDTDRIDYFVEEDDGTIVPIASDGWTIVGAAMRPAPGQTPLVDLLPVFNGEIVEITITPAMKTALGQRTGVWELELLDPSGAPIIDVRGWVQIEPRNGVT